jgi:hypothetical protein
MEEETPDLPRRDSAPVEVIRALGVLSEPPGPEHVGIAEALDLGHVPDHTRYAELFLFQLYPYASVYLGSEGMLGGEARSRIGGFWRAVGRPPPAEPDHLGALLGLYAGLLAEAERVEGAGSELAHRAATALLHEHLASWCFPYLQRIRELDPGFFGRWAALLLETLEGRLRLEGSPDVLPSHLRDAPGLADPRTKGGKGFLSELLTPVRTGLVLTRADLAELAGDLELGLRLGERRYILEHLLAQEPETVLEHIARRAQRDADEHRRRQSTLGVVAGFWADRAAATGSLLRELARQGRADMAAPEASSEIRHSSPP